MLFARVHHSASVSSGRRAQHHSAYDSVEKRSCSCGMALASALRPVHQAHPKA